MFRSRLLAYARSRLAFLAVRADAERGARGPDVGEEFQKVQRGLRRLGLAADRSSEILAAVGERLDEIQQAIRELRGRREAAVTLDEEELLRVLDELDRALEAPALPSAAAARVEKAKADLLSAVGWTPVAAPGGPPDGADIRITEFIDGPPADEEDSPSIRKADDPRASEAHGRPADEAHGRPADEAQDPSTREAQSPSPSGMASRVRIHRVLEQGYRGKDGSLLRRAVVIAAESPLERRRAPPLSSPPSPPPSPAPARSTSAPPSPPSTSASTSTSLSPPQPPNGALP